MTTPLPGRDLFQYNRGGSPSDSDTSGIGSDFSDTALLELIVSNPTNHIPLLFYS